MKIIEATSGNTGIALSHYAREKGYEICIVMPENMTEERKRVIKDLGAELVLCGEGSFAEAAEIRDEMASGDDCFNPDQFSNPLNVECHEKTTGQEILQQMKENSETIGAFVAGVGTGGTLIGVGKALRKAFPDVHLVAVEPSESPVMSGGEGGMHSIPGIGDGFIPAIAGNGNDGLNELIDEVICISSEDAKEAARHIEREYGYCVGISSGANYLAAKQLSEKYGSVVTVLPDGYVRYKSQGLKASESCECPHGIIGE